MSLSTSLYLPLVYPTYRPHIADYIRQKQKELALAQAHETCTSTAVKRDWTCHGCMSDK